MYLPLKALHIIFVVSWFAGLFYIVRLFVYLAEAHDKPAVERDILLPQLQLMARRLWFGITWPAGLATLGFGLAMLPSWWPPPRWLEVKLAAVVVLCAYHLYCHRLNARFQQGERAITSRNARILNEGATVLLVAIVFVVVLKDALALVQGVVGLVAFAAVLMLAIAAYRRLRSG